MGLLWGTRELVPDRGGLNTAAELEAISRYVAEELAFGSGAFAETKTARQLRPGRQTGPQGGTQTGRQTSAPLLQNNA